MLSSPNDVDVSSNVGIRRFELGLCEINRGHEHNYDHLLIATLGGVALLDEAENEIAILIAGDNIDYAKIPAGVVHAVKGLRAKNVYRCIFSHRDFDGMILQKWEGNNEAYGHHRLIEPTPTASFAIHFPLYPHPGLPKALTKSNK